jgi:aminoglycoside phosphotransferase (APT) family kinase protein
MTVSKPTGSPPTSRSQPLPSDATGSAAAQDLQAEANAERSAEENPHQELPVPSARAETRDSAKEFNPKRRLEEAARAVPRMEQVAGTLTTAEASAIAEEAVAENPKLLGGAFNLNRPVERPDGAVLLRFPRGDRTQREAQPLKNYDAARQAADILRDQHGPDVSVPQALWAGREQEGGERAEIWELFDGEQVEKVEKPPPNAQTATEDTITAFATRDPSSLHEKYPEQPRTCGEAHAELLRHFEDNLEPSHWEEFGQAYEVIGARREAVGVRSGRYEHPAPELPSRLVHNDPNPRNFLVDNQDPSKFALVDWDLATLGDPAFDIARYAQTWKLPLDQVTQRVEQEIRGRDARMAEHLAERVQVNYQLLHYQRLLLLGSMISDTMRAAPKDPEGWKGVRADAAAYADKMLPSVAEVLGTRVIPGEQFVDLVLQSEKTTAARRKGRRTDAPFPARVAASSG